MIEPLAVFIRPLGKKDLSQVCTIEKKTYPFPWTDAIHQDCVESYYPSLVLEFEKKIIGYAVFNYLYDECHLMNIAIDPDYQGKKFASRLIHGMYQRAKDANMEKVILEVRASNYPAIAFYKKEGFEEIGLRKNYYKDEIHREDAIVMEKAL